MIACTSWSHRDPVLNLVKLRSVPAHLHALIISDSRQPVITDLQRIFRSFTRVSNKSVSQVEMQNSISLDHVIFENELLFVAKDRDHEYMEQVLLVQMCYQLIPWFFKKNKTIPYFVLVY